MILRFNILMGLPILGAAFISNILLSQSLFAQSSDLRDAPLRLAENVMNQYSKCLVTSKRRLKIIENFLKIPDNHPDQNNVDKKLIVSGCVEQGAELRFQGTLFNRSLYTALYLKNYANIEPVDLKINPSHDYNSEIAAQYGKMSDGQLALRKISDCAIQNNAKAAHDFVIADLRSLDEDNSIADVVSAFSACLPVDTRLEFSRTNIKGQLAEALYKLRTAPSNNASSNNRSSNGVSS